MTFVVWEGEGSARLPGRGVGGADLCNPRGVSGGGSQAGFNLQPPASGDPQSEGISGREADVSPRLPRRPARHSIGHPPEGPVGVFWCFSNPATVGGGGSTGEFAAA